MPSDFSAASSSLGHLYQVRAGLLLALEDESSLIRIEALDDIEVESTGGKSTLYQLKHVATGSALTNLSRDLWKTIRVWSELVASGLLREEDKLVLMTTATAPAGSIPERLTSRECDYEDICTQLETLATESGSVSLQPAFNAFLKLERPQRLHLVSRVTVIDGSDRIGDLTRRLERRISIAVSSQFRTLARKRLEGWWYDEVVRHLAGTTQGIESYRVYAKVRDIAASFEAEALPIDFRDAEPDEIDAANDRRPFVLQLRAVSANLGRIEKAILDYYRAFEQRARWAREDLTTDSEMGLYENRLVDEWERVRLGIENEMDLGAASEEELKKAGRELLTWVEQTADVRLREKVTEYYVLRGSYHMLANAGSEARVWWHPKFKERAASILGVDEEDRP
jgi:hypothetical protein